MGFYLFPKWKMGFAIVCEYGTHQKIPKDEETKFEFDKTFQAFLLFLKEAPLVNIKIK